MIYVVRHGQTVFNAEVRFQGHVDSPLTAPSAGLNAEALGHDAPVAIYARIAEISMGAGTV